MPSRAERKTEPLIPSHYLWVGKNVKEYKSYVIKTTLLWYVKPQSKTANILSFFYMYTYVLFKNVK